jgi:hypothetical protein
LEEKLAAPVKKTDITVVGIRHTDHATPSIRKKLALTWLTSGGRSVGIVLSRTKAMEILLLFYIEGLGDKILCIFIYNPFFDEFNAHNKCFSFYAFVLS